jgi:hypothetical protein
MRRNIRKILLTIGVLHLISCSPEFKRSMGIIHNSPDEYAVLKNPPLSIPPNFDLVPPQDGSQITSSAGSAVITAGSPVVAQTKHVNSGDSEMLLGSQASSKVSVSESDKDFIEKFSGHEKREDIRDLIEIKEPDDLNKKSADQSSQGDSASNDDKKNGDSKVTIIDKLKDWF